MTGESGQKQRTRLGLLIRIVLLLLVITVVAHGLITGAILLNHHRSDTEVNPALLSLADTRGGMERVEFVTRDGITLRGEILGDPLHTPLVVFGHGYRDHRRQGDPLARDLLTSGFSVMLFDFRGGGGSDGFITTCGALEWMDVEAAIRYLIEDRGIPPSDLAYVGFSMGAASALLAADNLPTLGAIVLIAPYARMEETFEARTRHFARLPLRPLFSPSLWLFSLFAQREVGDVNPVDHSKSLYPSPLLVLGSERDWRAPPEDLKAILDSAGESANLMVLKDGSHSHLSRLQEDVRGPVVEYLSRNLSPQQ